MSRPRRADNDGFRRTAECSGFALKFRGQAREMLRRRLDGWGLSACILLVGYALVLAVVLALWSAVRWYVPGFDEPHPTAGEVAPLLAATIVVLLGIVVALVGLSLSVVGIYARRGRAPLSIVTLVVAFLGLLALVWSGIIGVGLLVLVG